MVHGSSLSPPGRRDGYSFGGNTSTSTNSVTAPVILGDRHIVASPIVRVTLPFIALFVAHLDHSMGTTSDHRPGSVRSDDKESDATTKANSQRNYDLCVRAANHITSIITGWRTHFCIRRAPVWLCYNVFTAGIMHVNACECSSV